MRDEQARQIAEEKEQERLEEIATLQLEIQHDEELVSDEPIADIWRECLNSRTVRLAALQKMHTM